MEEENEEEKGHTHMPAHTHAMSSVCGVSNGVSGGDEWRSGM